MRKDKKSLAETHPEVAKQWHPTRNEDLSPKDFTYGSTKKVWWKCDKGVDHEWDSVISSRSQGTGCPICSNNMVVRSNCMATTHPELAKEWHPTKNGDITPFDITAGSNKRIWWKCDKGDDHQWRTSANARKSGSGCGVCAGLVIVKSNSLGVTHPELTSEWHPAKNGHLTPYEVGYGSGKKVWWKCNKGDDHEWISKVSNRVHGNSCPVCSNNMVVRSNCMATTHPELAKEWHPTKNGDITPFDITTGSNKRFWWKCDKGDDHQWRTSANNRLKGTNCAICNGKVVVPSNCLATTHPELINKWHPKKNGKLTPFNVVSGSGRKVWWQCEKEKNHIWYMAIEYVSKYPDCSQCNSIIYSHPNIVNEWYFEKNGLLKPSDFTSGSGKKVWWKCDKGDDHIWRTSIGKRTSGQSCPVCSNNMVVRSNCMATTHPELAKEWHPTKNGDITPLDITAGTHKKVWWKCEKGDDHVWKTTVVSRRERGCPFCTLTPQSKQELTITFELMKLFKNINPKGLKTRLDGRLRAIDIYIPKLNLCIEFDGSYWHKDKRYIDKIKSEMLFEEGFKLIRVREEPLKKIYDTDVISKQPYDGKQVTNDILSMILYIFELDTKLVSKIKAYQSKDDLQNEKGLEIYIDKILTEKAENK